MSKRVRRRLFERVLIWEPKSGTIFDLPTRYVLPLSGPSEEEEYATLTTGSKRPIRRTNAVQIPVSARELALMGEVIQRTKCPVKAAFIGASDTDNWLWLEPTRLQVRDPAIRSGQMAQKVLELESNVFYPGIWEGEDILAGVPWQGTKDWKDPDSSRVLLRPDGNVRGGYEGPLWNVAASSEQGRTVALDGSTSGITATNPAIIRIELPAWEATLRLDAPPGYTITSGSLRVLDWDGQLLTADTSGDGATVTLPDDSWFVEVEIDESQARPRLRVDDTGVSDVRIRVGETTPDCTKVADPQWSELPNPNEPPYWKQKGKVQYEPDNVAPTWESRDDLEYATEPPPGNTNPTWESRDNLEYSVETSTADFQIGDTTDVFTGEGGLSQFDYPDGGAYQITFDDLADGQIKADLNVPAVFAAQNGGIVRFDPASKSLPPATTQILSVSGNIRGLALDRGTNTIYYTYESKTGLYLTGYGSDSGETELTSNLSADEWYLAADSIDREGYIFAASSGANQIVRFNISDGSNKTVVIDGANFSKTVYEGVALSQTLKRIVFQTASSTEKTLHESDYDGNDESSLVSVFSSVPTDDLHFGVADKEGVVIDVTEVENGFCSVSYYALKDAPGSEPADITIDNADTGKRVTTGFDYTINGNSNPTWESRDNLEYQK